MPMLGTTFFYILLIIFAATLIRSVFGFGEALIAVPLLALRLPIDVAAPVAVLVSITVAAVFVVEDWQHVDVRSAGWLLAASAVGTPFGVLLLIHGNQRLVKAALGVLIVAFAVYALSRVHLTAELLASDRPWLLGCGFCAGILGGAYGMNGPPLVIYGAMRRWPAKDFRATLQGYFLPASLIGMAGFWMAGLLSATVTRYYLFSLPATAAAIVLGRLLNRRVHGPSFLRYVHILLLLVGVALIAQVVRRT